jgi:predicted enzyme related to lactoylglutathione lyase
MVKSSRDVIIRTESLAEAERKGATHGPVFELLVADVEAMKTRLIAAGCTLIEEDRSIPRCYIRDPYGVTFNIGRAAAP